MKILKILLITVVALVALVAIVGLFMPSSFHMERTMVMKSQPDAVYNQVNDLKNWNNWMPFNKMDKNMKITYGDKTAGEGANYHWDSKMKDLGTGSTMITKSVPNQIVESSLDFGDGGKATGNFKIEKTDAGTNVTWGFDCDMGSNPFKKFMGLMMDKMMGPVFVQGLKSLDSSAAVMPPPMQMAAIPSDSTKMAEQVAK